jgi:hypothetical protein
MLPRRSDRLITKPKVQYYPLPRRKRYRITLTVTVANYAQGGTMPNVYGQPILQPGTGHGTFQLSITRDIYRRGDGVLEQQPPGIGYEEITDELYDRITTPGLMRDSDVREMVMEQFKTMHAYTWAPSVAFSDPRFEPQEVNAEGVLRQGRTPRTMPMLRAAPMRLPFLRHGIAAVSLRDAEGKELCVPSAVYAWLQTRDEGKGRKHKTHVYVPQAARDRYPDAFPVERNAHRKKLAPKVSLETVTALLNAIHRAKSNFLDLGHTVEDVEEFCALFNCKMIALDRDGVVIAHVADGDHHYPLCFTNAHGHMYWHCDVEDIKSIAERAKRQCQLGSKHFLAQGGAIASKVMMEKASRELCVVDRSELIAIVKHGSVDVPTAFLVKGTKDVEDIFFEHGWTHGEPGQVRVREKRVLRFSIKLPSGVELAIGADPFYEQVLRAASAGKEFDHAALFQSCKQQGIALDPLDGLGNAARSILRPARPRVTQQERQALYDRQDGTCASCPYTFDSCKRGHADHVTPLGQWREARAWQSAVALRAMPSNQDGGRKSSWLLDGSDPQLALQPVRAQRHRTHARLHVPRVCGGVVAVCRIAGRVARLRYREPDRL